MWEVIPPQLQGLAFPFILRRNIDAFLPPVTVSVNSSTLTLSTSHTSQICVACKPAESALCASMQDINEKLTQPWPHYQSLRRSRVTILQWDPVLLAKHFRPGSSVSFQSISLSIYWPLVHDFTDENIVGDGMQSESKINKTTQLPSSTELAISFQKAIRWIKHHFPFINPVWLILTTLSLMNLKIVFRINCFINFSGPFWHSWR